MNDAAPILNVDFDNWIQTFRGITTSTNERTLIANTIQWSGVGNSAPVIDFTNARAVSAALIIANMNSLPLDWIARISMGGVNMNYFIVKQLPVLCPEAYVEESTFGNPWIQLIIPRVLELTYTSEDLIGFATDLGFQGPPFDWDENRRHCLQCELDSIYAYMYKLNYSELEWILDATEPSFSFPTLKQKELANFGEFRTKRYVLDAFSRLEPW